MRLTPLPLVLAIGVSVCAEAQEARAVVTQAPAPEMAEPREPFRLGGEIKAGWRWSEAQASQILDAKATGIGFMRTPDPGTSFEIQHLALNGEGEIASGVFARFEVRFLDLYNRNPTSTDAQVFVRQAFVRFGDKAEPLSGDPESKFYAVAGMAPRFSKQTVRHMESYGLLGTAVGRFEQPQLEVGASLGKHFYARGMVGSGNPLFLRDTNALAGDEISEAAADPRAVYGTGFPILYDAKVGELNVQGSAEKGIGLGTRFGNETASADVLAWRFSRRLGQTARLRGTDYPGELALLSGAGSPLATRGNKRSEWGVNLQAKVRDLRVFAEWIDQDLAGVKRHGIEVEAAYTIALPGLFLVKESPFGNWLQPSFRYSETFNEFEAPVSFPRISVHWPWKKYDFGLRMGLVRNVDLTAEYTVHQVFRFAGLKNLPMQEFIATVRAGF